MTPVDFRFVTPEGAPIAHTSVEIQLAKAGFDAASTGIAVPRPILAQTNAQGEVTVELWPSQIMYYVTLTDPESEASLFYNFYVPAMDVPGTSVRLQDIVVDGAVSNTTYDVAALALIQSTKANVLAAQVSTTASEQAAAVAKSASESSAQSSAESAAASVAAKEAAHQAKLDAQEIVNQVPTIAANAGGTAANQVISAVQGVLDAKVTAASGAANTAELSKQTAQKWADSSTSPDNTGSKSAKTYAADSSASAESARQSSIVAALSGTTKTYLTYAAMLADVAQPNPTQGRVTSDAVPARNAYYVWTTAWALSGLQPADAAVLSSEVAARNDLVSVVTKRVAYAHVVVNTDSGDIIQGVRDDGRLQFAAVYDLPLVAPDGSTALAYPISGGSMGIDNITLGQSLQIFEQRVPGYRSIVADAAGNILEGIKLDGTKVGVSTAAPVAVSFNDRFDIVHLLGLGQSWMGGTGGAPVVTSVPRTGVSMFVGGVRPFDASTDPAVSLASFVPAIEATNTGNVRGETPMSGFAAGLLDAVSALGYTMEVLISVVAPGGAPLVDLTKGSSYYTQLLQQVAYAYANAQALGKTYCVGAIPFIQGKGDYDDGEVNQYLYLQKILSLRADLDRDIKALVPGNPDVAMVVFQTGSHGHNLRQPTIDLALMQATGIDENIIMGGAMYWGQRAVGDTVHFTAASYKAFGYAGALSFVRTKLLGKPPGWIAPSKSTVQGKLVSVDIATPTPPLVLDTAWVSDPGSMGFGLVDSGGNALTISTVAVVAPGRVRVTAAAAVPVGARLRYGFSGVYVVNGVGGPRGCLHDSTAPTRNACPIFEINL